MQSVHEWWITQLSLPNMRLDPTTPSREHASAVGRSEEEHASRSKEEKEEQQQHR
jgi:hypothetical protein